MRILLTSLSALLFSLFVTCSVSAQSAGKATTQYADREVESYSNGTDPVTHAKFVIHWGDLKADDFGPRTVTFSDEGLRKLHPVPAPGVHPRILFTPDDLPEMRARMKESRSGQIMHSHLLAFSAALRGHYDEHAAYAQPDLWKGDYRGSHGNVILWYYHDKDSVFNPANHIFERLMAGDKTIDPKNLWSVFALDALRCLIDEDAAGAQQLARAVNTALVHDQAARDAALAAKHDDKPLASPVSGGAGGQDLGYLYDFLYNWLTPQQRTDWHAELANATWAHDNYGTFSSAVSTRSNWATFTYWLMPLLAIEGEPGYNELKAQGIYRGYRNFLTYGIFPDGAFVEGEAKDQLGGDGLVAMAMRRRPDLFGHPYLQAYAKDFLPHSILPNPEYKEAQSDFPSGPFVRFDLLGGLGLINSTDAMTLKYMFPRDRIIDWVYRNEVGQNYERLPNRGNSGYWDDLLLAAIFASDFDPANNDPARLGLDLSYFSGERAVLLTRSDWTSGAMELGMHTRELNGGHAFGDRNSIFVFGAGRAWFALNQRNGDTTTQGEVVIDHKLQSVNSPGRVVDYVNNPLATFAVGDASYAWDWTLETLTYASGYTADQIRAGQVKITPGFEPEMHSINDFAYTKMADDYANAPLFHLHGWIAPDGRYSPVVRKPNYPVVKAFRTAGLVRGAHPYSLVVDDIQKDDTTHHYDWQTLLEKDLGIAKVEQLVAAKGVMDITLAAGGSAKAGEPMLLVRVLACKPAAAGSKIMPKLVPVGDPQGDKKKPILQIPVDAVSPEFKVLLYPYHQGDVLPKTAWNAAHDQLKIELPGYTDTVTFHPAATGKTDVKVVRSEAGKSTVLVDVVKPVPPLPAGAPLSAATQMP